MKTYIKCKDSKTPQVSQNNKALMTELSGGAETVCVKILKE
jgi:hypothetical protein